MLGFYLACDSDIVLMVEMYWVYTMARSTGQLELNTGYTGQIGLTRIECELKLLFVFKTDMKWTFICK